jgi:Rho termination factor, N-terminal domain
MTLRELQKFAKQLGLNPGKVRKAELIKAIQRAEGNFDCFGTAKEYCDQLNCLFREDCLE